MKIDKNVCLPRIWSCDRGVFVLLRNAVKKTPCTPLHRLYNHIVNPLTFIPSFTHLSGLEETCSVC